MVRRPPSNPASPTCASDRPDALPTLHRAQPELLRPERHVLVHRRAEELVVGVLKEQPDLPPDRVQVLRRHRRAPHEHRRLPIDISGSSPFRCSSSVLLPAPFGPINPTHSPVRHAKTHPAQRLRPVAVAVVQVAHFDLAAHRHPRAHIAA